MRCRSLLASISHLKRAFSTRKRGVWLSFALTSLHSASSRTSAALWSAPTSTVLRPAQISVSAQHLSKKRWFESARLGGVQARFWLAPGGHEDRITVSLRFNFLLRLGTMAKWF